MIQILVFRLKGDGHCHELQQSSLFNQSFPRFIKDDRIPLFSQIWQVSEADSKLLLHEHSLPIPQEQRVIMVIAVDGNNGDY